MSEPTGAGAADVSREARERSVRSLQPLSEILGESASRQDVTQKQQQAAVRGAAHGGIAAAARRRDATATEASEDLAETARGSFMLEQHCRRGAAAPEANAQRTALRSATPVRFRMYANYSSFIDRAEVRIFQADQSLQASRSASLPSIQRASRNGSRRRISRGADARAEIRAARLRQERQLR